MTPEQKTETLEREQFRQGQRKQFEEVLSLWRQSGTPRFEMAAREIDALRSLVDDQLAAMKNMPASDMNHAGRDWQRRATAIREGR